MPGSAASTGGIMSPRVRWLLCIFGYIIPPTSPDGSINTPSVSQSDMDANLNDLRECLHIEEKIRELVLPQLDRLKEEVWKGWGFQLPKEEVILSGSFIEGPFHSRVFHKGKPHVEADIMFSLGSIEDINSALVNCEDEGFFKIRNRGMADYVYGQFSNWGSNQATIGTEFCSALEVKWLAHQYLYHCENLETILLTFLPGGEEGFDFDFTEQVEGPSAMFDMTVRKKSNKQVVMQLAVDRVPCFRLSQWPNEACRTEWRNRDRNWPEESVVEEVVLLSHLVPKEGPENPTEYDWRESFSEAEGTLISMYSKEQKLLYALFKGIFYSKIKSDDEDALASYSCKTTMFRMMQEYGSTFCAKGDYKNCLLVLLQELLVCIEEKCMPHFFNAKINILGKCSVENLQRAASIIEGMIKDVTADQLVLDTRSVLESFQEFHGHIQYINSKMNDLSLFYPFLRLAFPGIQCTKNVGSTEIAQEYFEDDLE